MRIDLATVQYGFDRIEHHRRVHKIQIHPANKMYLYTFLHVYLTQLCEHRCLNVDMYNTRMNRIDYNYLVL